MRQESKNNLVYLQADKCTLAKTLDTKEVFYDVDEQQVHPYRPLSGNQ